MSNHYPWKKYSRRDIINEFLQLREKASQDTLSEHSNLGKGCSNAFFQYERMNTPRIAHCSNVEYWKKHKKEVLSHNQKDTGSLFRTLHFLNKPPCQFSVAVSCLVYRLFSVSSVFDPYAGWGDRLVGSMALDIDYTGCDLNEHLKEPYSQLVSTLSPHCHSRVKMFFQPSEKRISYMKKKHFDMMFSSPPFFSESGTIVEKYHQTNPDYESFLVSSLIPVLNYGFNHCKIVCMYIPNHMYKDLLTRSIPKATQIISFGTGRNFDVEGKKKPTYLYCWINEI